MSEKRKGPKLTVTRSCDGCRYEASESYAVQGDSGFRVLCEHPHLGVRRIGDTTWTTPEWCPERGSESAPESAALASEREARQRAEQQRDELLSDWKEIDALPPVRAAFEEGMMLVDAVAKAIADSHYAEGTPLFDAEVAKSFAEAERDEARAERDVAVKGREHAISVQVSEGIRADRAEQQRDEARAQLEALRVAVAAYVADEDEDRTTTFDAMAAPMTRVDRHALVLAYDWLSCGWGRVGGTQKRRESDATFCVEMAMDALALGHSFCDDLVNACLNRRGTWAVPARILRARLALAIRAILRADRGDFGPSERRDVRFRDPWFENPPAGWLPAFGHWYRRIPYTPLWERAGRTA